MIKIRLYDQHSLKKICVLSQLSMFLKLTHRVLFLLFEKKQLHVVMIHNIGDGYETRDELKMGLWLYVSMRLETSMRHGRHGRQDGT